MQNQESVINSSANKICRPALLMRPVRQLCIAERIFKQYVVFIHNQPTYCTQEVRLHMKNCLVGYHIYTC